MSSALEFEFFPDRSGDAPSEWVRAQLARGCIVVQFYSADGNKVMRRSQMSFTRELVADAAPVLLGQVVVSEMRRHTNAGEPDA